MLGDDKKLFDLAYTWEYENLRYEMVLLRDLRGYYYISLVFMYLTCCQYSTTRYVDSIMGEKREAFLKCKNPLYEK